MAISTIRSILFSVLFVLSLAASGQNYHVVIGSFSTENAAVKFSGYARSLHYDAAYLLNESKSLYYVYVIKTLDRSTASEQTFRLRRETEFTDAWMYYDGPDVPVEKAKANETVVIVPPVDEPPKTVVVKIEPKKEEPVKKEIVKEPVVEEPVKKEPIKEETPAEEPRGIVEPAITFTGPEKPVAKGTFYKFNLMNSEGKPIQGQVYNVDRQAMRDLATYKANEYVDVRRPSIQGMPITIVCEIFGYIEVVRVIDYLNPETTEGATKDENGAWVIPITLERIKKGDVSILYKISFYKDAVIMTPNSKPELDALVQLMKMNPTFKIKIHGHNNGNEKGIRIITLGSDKNYFSMARSLSKTGSAKDLSQLRAETIKSYLIDNGIKKDRVDTYGWGGTVMLVQPGTAAATRLNNRMEIEVTQD